MITHATQSSRNIADLHPELQKRLTVLFQLFEKSHPACPQPFVVQTSRSFADQDADYAKGRTAPGKIITNARGGQSLHNYAPAMAFDVAFKDRNGEVIWLDYLFQYLGALAPKVGIEWGGSWRTFQDHPHFQPQRYTWEMASQNIEPTFPPIAAQS